MSEMKDLAIFIEELRKPMDSYMKANKERSEAADIIEEMMNNPDLEEFDDPSWIDRHSVNCYYCADLIDERDCMPADKWNNNNGGDICPKCQKTHKPVIT